MKKTLTSIALIAIFLIAGLTGLHAREIKIKVKNTDNLISVSYSFSKPVVDEINIGEEIYYRLLMADASGFGNPGEPCLPAKGTYILLPQQTQVKDIVVTGEKVAIDGTFLIEPCEQPRPVSQLDSAPLPTPNDDIYCSSEIFPDRLYDEISVQCFRGYKILVIRLYPVQYIPSTGELFYYPSLSVSVETVEDSRVHPLYRGLEKDKQMVMQKVDNLGVVDTYTRSSYGNERNNDESYDLMIITKNELKDGLARLLDKHNANGVRSKIQTVEDIYSEYSGVDNAEKIRNFIIYAYTNYGIDYVLIAGDSYNCLSEVPVRNLNVNITIGSHSETRVEIPSDFYFACLDGTYNFDGDEWWGEYNDGVNFSHPDLYAEVFVGRACVDTEKEMDYFVDKTVKYMNTASKDLYLKKVLLAGEYTDFIGEAKWGGNFLNELIDFCNDHGYPTKGIPSNTFNINTLYDQNWPLGDEIGWPVKILIFRINMDVHIINHVGHADRTSVMKISSSPSTGNIDELQNNKHFFIHSVGCSAGWFDNNDDDDCIAEYLTIKNSYGAFAGLFNTRQGFSHLSNTDGPSPRLLREFWDAVYGENITLISQAIYDAKEDNIWHINTSNSADTMRYVIYTLTLFGDPALSFVEPKTKDVSYNNKRSVYSEFMEYFPLLKQRLLVFLEKFPLFKNLFRT